MAAFAKHKCGSRGFLNKKFMANLRKIKELTKPVDYRPEFASSKITDFRWPFTYRCDSEGERIFLCGRIRSYLFNQRRGRFRLPSKFKDLEAEVSKLTKRQLREGMYQNTSDYRIDSESETYTIDLVNAVAPHTIWRPPRSNLEEMARRVDTHRLTKRDWPRISRSLWPSFPSLGEVMEATRQGKTCPDLWRIGWSGKSCSIRSQMHDRASVTRMVERNVLAIRATVSVPRQFLPWFRYRSGMLFLTVRGKIPIKLVRLLAAEWIKCPYNLWLQVPCRFKSYLKLTAEALPGRGPNASF